MCARMPRAYTLTQIFHDSPAATTDIAALPGVLGCSFDKLPATTLGTGRTAHSATYRSGTVRGQGPAVRRRPIHEILGLKLSQ